jgi:hypothetical protein
LGVGRLGGGLGRLRRMLVRRGVVGGRGGGIGIGWMVVGVGERVMIRVRDEGVCRSRGACCSLDFAALVLVVLALEILRWDEDSQSRLDSA